MRILVLGRSARVFACGVDCCMSLVECGIQPRGRYDAKRSMPSGKHSGYDIALGTCCEMGVRAILDFGFMSFTGR